MDILNNIQIGDQSIDDKGQVEIMDEDRLCFIVKSKAEVLTDCVPFLSNCLGSMSPISNYIQTTMPIRQGKICVERPIWTNLNMAIHPH